MRRSIDQALLDLRGHVAEWGRRGARPGIWVFVYPPEWEAAMLERLAAFADDCAAAGWPLELADVGQGLLAEVEGRQGLVDQLRKAEQRNEDRARQDLGTLAERYLIRLLKTPISAPHIARLLVNTSSLSTLVSYSAIANALHDDSMGGDVSTANILAFPGEGDDRSLNLLRLRVDTNYRVPRI